VDRTPRLELFFPSPCPESNPRPHDRHAANNPNRGGRGGRGRAFFVDTVENRLVNSPGKGIASGPHTPPTEFFVNGSTAPSYSRSGPGLNERILFWASFATLVAAGIGFSVRGAILGDWGKQFGFTQTESASAWRSSSSASAPTCSATAS
jgi:hypothetical protein